MFSDNGGSGVSEVSVGIGATGDDVNILPWTNIEGDSASISVTIPDGINAWVKLQVIDKG